MIAGWIGLIRKHPHLALFSGGLAVAILPLVVSGIQLALALWIYNNEFDPPEFLIWSIRIFRPIGWVLIVIGVATMLVAVYRGRRRPENPSY